uniref:ABC transporter G family member 19 n=1 Tax=Zeugodacus cucurbitae TaxID=28588 RepID=A0A0A1WXR3_ZEUCU
MLKKSKNSKYPPPPAPPTVEEILKDMETFHVDLSAEALRRQSPTNDVQHQDWWNRFEQAVADHKNLIMLDSEIRNYQLKLESTKIELETEAQLLMNAIQEQREKMDEVLQKGSS